MTEKVDWSSFEVIDAPTSVATKSDSSGPVDWSSFEVVGPEEKPKTSILRRAGDVGIAALKGAIGVPETAVGLADIVTGGRAGKLAEEAGFRPKEAKAILSEYLSPEQQAANLAVSEAKGFTETAKAAIQNPSVIGQQVIESLPSMGAGGLIGRGLAAGAKIAPWAAGAIGEGIVGGGQAAEQARQQAVGGLITPRQAAAAVASGVGTAAFGMAGGRIAQRLGIADVDTMLAGGGSALTSKGVAKRIIEGGISEGAFEELPQSIQETIWQNVAMDKPILEGVPESAAMGLLTGAAMGGAAGGTFRGRPTVADISAAQSVDEAIAAATASVESQPAPTAAATTIAELERTAGISTPEQIAELPTAEPDIQPEPTTPELTDIIKRGATRDEIFAQRESELAAQEALARETGIRQLVESGRDLQLEQAAALTEAQGFGEAEPTAMQLAMQQAQARRQLLMTPVSQRAESVQAEQAIAQPATISQAAAQIPESTNVEPTSAAAIPVRNVSTAGAIQAAPERVGIEGAGAPTIQPAPAGLPDTGIVSPAARISVPGADERVQRPAAVNKRQESIANLESMTGKQLRGIAASEKRAYMRNAAAEILQTRSQETRQKRSELAKKIYVKSKQIDPDRDTMAQAIAKLGGINSESAAGRMRLAPEELNIRGHGVLRVFNKAGRSMDEVGAQLADLGYVQHDANGKYDQTDFEDKLAEVAGGAEVLTPNGMMQRAQENHDQAMQEVGATSPEEYATIESDIEQVPDDVQKFIDDAFDNTQLQGALSDEEIDRLFEPAGVNVPEVTATGQTREGDQGNQAPPAGDENFLQSESEAEANARLAAAKEKTRLADLELKRLDEVEKHAKIQKEIDQRKAASAENFQLGQTAEEAISGQEPLFSKQGQRVSGITVAEVVKATARLRAKWLGFTKVNTVQSVNDLPADILDRVNPDAQTEGFYDPQTQSVYLIADNIASPDRAAWVASHEVVGHGGLRMLKDKTVNDALNLAGSNRFVRELSTAIAKDRGGLAQNIATEEAIAEMAAAIETNDFQALTDRYGVIVPDSAKNGIRGTIARVIDAVKRFLASVTGKPVADVSDADVRGLIAAQREAVETADEGHREPTGGAMQEALFSTAPTQWISPEPSRLDDFLYVMQDKHIDTKRVVEVITKVSGQIQDELNPRLQETLFSGRSADATQEFLKKELKPLYIEMQARKVTMIEIENYLWARHAPEANAHIAKINPNVANLQDGGSGMTNNQARDIMAGNAVTVGAREIKLDPAKMQSYAALAKRVDAINTSTQKLLVDSGLEKQSTIDAWNATYKNYVPLHRDDVGDGRPGIGQGFSVRGPSSKRRMGSGKEVIDILANIVMQRERTILRAEKNPVSMATYGLAIQQPNKEFWLPVNPNNIPSMTPQQYQEMEFELISLGLDPADAANVMAEPKQRYIDPRTGLVAERINPILRSSPNVLALRVNGEDRFVFFNEKDPRAQRMVTALKNLDADQLGVVLAASAKVSRWFAAVNTQYNPVFGMVNFTRDIQSALLSLSATEIAGKQKAVLGESTRLFVKLAAKGFRMESLTGADAALWQEFKKEGGKTGFRDMFANSTDRAKALQSEINQISEGKIKGAGRAIFNWLSDYNESLESIVRIATYKVAKENGISNQRAAAIAKDLMNFNRKGTIALQAGALYAFFNASAQGTMKVAQTLRGPAGKKIVTGGLLLGAMQAFMLAAAGFGDDEPPEFVKERSLVIPTLDGKYIAIPMPLGFNVIPTFSRIVTDWALSGGENTAKKTADIFALLAGSFNPIGNAGLSIQTIAPTAVDPFVALSENRDFTGKPIAREDLSGLKQTPGYTRAKDTASEWSKTLSYYLNLVSGGTKYQPGTFSPTPDQIDYLIGQVTGGVGREITKTAQAVTSTITGEELPPHKIPLLGRFYGDTKGHSAEASKFYDNLKRLNGHKLEIEGRREHKEDVSEYLRENKDAMLIKAGEKMQRRVSELNKMKRALIEKDAPKERIKMIEEKVAEEMKSLNDRMASLQE